jgi:hypothetical protein
MMKVVYECADRTTMSVGVPPGLNIGYDKMKMGREETGTVRGVRAGIQHGRLAFRVARWW